MENISELRAAFEDAVHRLKAHSEHTPSLEIDCEIQFDEIGPQLMDELHKLEPFGTDNPPPIFSAKDVLVASAAIVGKNHRRMSLWQVPHSNNTIDAIQFNLLQDTVRADRFDRLAFRLQWNRYRGKKRIQIIVEDF